MSPLPGPAFAGAVGTRNTYSAVLIDRHVIEPLSGMSFLNGFPVRVEKLG